MFTSILTSSQLTLTQVALCTLAALASGLVIACAYHMAGKASRSFSLTVAFLPVMVMVVILMVNGNLGAGVAVAGSFSLVRFRSMPGKASDIAAVFLAMGAGLACGMGYAVFAAVFSVVISGLALLAAKSSLFSKESSMRYLMITIPEDLNYADAFADIFESYAGNAKLISMRTVNLGALYELRYEVELKDENREKEMLDMIRTRNGNLTIQSSLLAPTVNEL